MTPQHCRAARAWLDWSQSDLSQRANIGLSTIRQFENGLRQPITNNLLAMQRAFEDAGITFTASGITFSDPRAELQKLLGLS